MKRSLGDDIDGAVQVVFEGLLKRHVVNQASSRLQSMSTSRSLWDRASPRAADPKSRTFVAPCSRASRRTVARRSGESTAEGIDGGGGMASDEVDRPSFDTVVLRFGAASRSHPPFMPLPSQSAPTPHSSFSTPSS